MATSDYRYDSAEQLAMTVENGTKADAEDVNKVWQTTQTKLTLLTDEVSDVYSSSILAYNWATSPTEVVDNAYGNGYSARMWASKDVGTVDGTYLSAYQYAVQCDGATTVATSAANFEGSWVAGTYTVPSAVFHDGEYWVLLSNTVTHLEEPGSSSIWQVISQGTRENLLIDPGFQVNFDGYTGTDLTSNVYGHTMWRSYSTTADRGVTRATNSEFVTLRPNGKFRQRTDELVDLSGEQVTFSVTDGGVFVTIDGTTLLWVDSNNPVTTTLTTWGVGIHGNGSTRVFSGLKVERGNKATPYDQPNVACEEIKAKKYYYMPLGVDSWFDNGLQVVGGTSGGVEIFIPTSVEMRSTPAVTLQYMQIRKYDGTGPWSLNASGMVTGKDSTGVSLIVPVTSYTPTFGALYVLFANLGPSSPGELKLDSRYY